MMVAALGALGQEAPGFSYAPIQWQGEPAGYIPMNDPSNPCYQDPNVATIVAPPPSAACNAWIQQHMPTQVLSGSVSCSGSCIPACDPMHSMCPQIMQGIPPGCPTPPKCPPGYQWWYGPAGSDSVPPISTTTSANFLTQTVTIGTVQVPVVGLLLAAGTVLFLLTRGGN